MSALSWVVACWLLSIRVLIWLLLISSGLPAMEHVQWEISSMQLRKPLLTRSISHSTFSTHCTHVFFAFQLHFYLSWNNKAQYAKNVVYLLPSSILKWLHKNSLILISFFLNARWYDSCQAVTVQSNRQLSATRATVWKKTNGLLASPVLCRPPCARGWSPLIMAATFPHTLDVTITKSMS